jgi:hypothetical protein
MGTNYAQYMTTCHYDASVFVYDWKVERVVYADPATRAPDVGESIVGGTPWTFEHSLQLSVSRLPDGRLASNVPCTRVTMGRAGGLFGDEVVSAALPDTAKWNLYSGPGLEYSFRYPPSWSVSEYLNAGRVEDYFQYPATYPVQGVELSNPAPEQGQNLEGINCTGDECRELPPHGLKVRVLVGRGECHLRGWALIGAPHGFITDEASTCLERGASAGARSLEIQIHRRNRRDGYITVALAKGREVTATQQAVLEAILASFRR